MTQILRNHYKQLMRDTWRAYLDASQRSFSSVIEAACVPRLLAEYHDARRAYYRLGGDTGRETTEWSA